MVWKWGILIEQRTINSTYRTRISASRWSSRWTTVSKRPSKKSKHDFTNIVTSESSFSNKPSNHSAITAAEIEAMGGKVPQTMKHQTKSSNMMVTDDEIGNGESIFDF